MHSLKAFVSEYVFYVQRQCLRDTMKINYFMENEDVYISATFILSLIHI